MSDFRPWPTVKRLHSNSDFPKTNTALDVDATHRVEGTRPAGWSQQQQPRRRQRAVESPAIESSAIERDSHRGDGSGQAGVTLGSARKDGDVLKLKLRRGSEELELEVK